MARDALTMTDWHLCVRNLEQATPAYPPGLVPAYHVIRDGFMLGELVQRVAGTTVRDFLHSALLAPLGMRDTFLGLPAEQLPRHVPVRGRGPAELATQLMVNRRATRQAVIPAASLSATGGHNPMGSLSSRKAFGQNGLTQGEPGQAQMLTRGAPGQAPASCPGAARTTATVPTAGAAAISPAPRPLRQPVPTGSRTSYWHRSRDFLASPALRTA